MDKSTGKRLAEINPQSATLELGGREFKLLPPDLNCLAKLEEHFDCPFDQIIVFLDPTKAGFVRAVRFVLTCIIQINDPDVTEDEIGKLVTLTNLNKVGEAINKAFSDSLPLPPEAITRTK